jgi:hypothetical protein
MFDVYAGLGMTCEITWQLSRLTGRRHGQLFDWQYTPHEALVRLLRTDFEDYFRLPNLVLSEDHRHVVDTANGMQFHHMFPHNLDGTVMAQRWVRDYERVRVRVDHLLKRWRETAASAQTVLYVRRDPDDEFTAEQVVALRDVFRERYPGHRFALLWARNLGTGRADVIEVAPGVYEADVTVAEPRAQRWQGDDEAWDRVYPVLRDLRPLTAAPSRQERGRPVTPSAPKAQR